jgi:peroxiredoxin/protein associated with RNAse G/E
MKRLVPLFILLLSPPLPAQDRTEKTETPAGHSYHGEVFNEGPRQAAVLIPGTGEVHLEVTTKSEEARRFFTQGVGQLHGYWFFEAERSFRQAAKLDPEGAMFYWGMAMANFKNDTRGKKFIDEAVEKKSQASEREKLWIDGLAAYFKDLKADAKKRLRDYVRSLEEILEKYPDEVEAEVFLLHQVFYNSGKEIPVSSHYAMNLLAEKILTKHPGHPANHFQIHLWDNTDPSQALKAAANCGPAAPGIAHMWHMPGHTYSKLQRYTDAAWQQEASARVDHAHLIRYQIVPDQIHNFAHNNEWLIRNLDSLGQHHRAVELARNMISLPRLAKFKTVDKKEVFDPSGGSWQYGKQRLRDTLVRYEDWKQVIALSGDGKDKTAPLHPDGEAITEIDFHRYVALARYESGDREGASKHLIELEKRLAAKQSEKDKAVTEAEKKATGAKKDAKAIEEAKKAAAKNFEKAITDLENPVKELRVYAALTASPPDKAKALETLPKLKDLTKWRHALLWQRAGKGDEAMKLAGEAVSSGKNELLPLVVQVRILHTNGDKERAKAAFTQLRTVAHSADADLAIFQPLVPIAREFGFPDDWRLAPATPKDLGKRPDLDTLGPFRWTPPAAPTVTLTDIENRTKSLFTAGGRPRVAIFFLGKGCSHCMEQLNAFAPVAKRFDEAGIDLVAISSDTPEGLKETLAGNDGKKSPFPFPLYSDASLTAFKAFRAHDDFEEMPLHGIYLIDRGGRIRWQEISYEPFMKPEWLLEECVRLLALEAAES